MAEHIQQVRTITNDGTVTETTRGMSTDDTTVAAPTTQPTSYIVARIIWFVAGIIITLLALRFVFMLLGANRGNGIVDLIYTLSYPLAAPFFGIFNYTSRYGISQFEVSTLVAIALYALIAWGLARLVTIRHPRTEA
jgi:hypothetical protein